MIDVLLRLDDRRIVVAGAGGGGIGTAICAAIVRAGGRVVAIDNDAARLEDARALGDAVEACLADARDPSQVDRALGREPIHGLVHVAGGSASMSGSAPKRSHWKRSTPCSIGTCGPHS